MTVTFQIQIDIREGRNFTNDELHRCRYQMELFVAELEQLKLKEFIRSEMFVNQEAWYG